MAPLASLRRYTQKIGRAPFILSARGKNPCRCLTYKTWHRLILDLSIEVSALSMRAKARITWDSTVCDRCAEARRMTKWRRTRTLRSEHTCAPEENPRLWHEEP